MSVKTEWKVNGIPIRAADIRADVAAMRREAESCGSELSLEDRLALPDLALERLVDRTILRCEADRLGLIPTREEAQKVVAELRPRSDGVSGCRADVVSVENMEDIRQRLGIDKLMDSCLAAAKRPQVRDVRHFYRKNRDLFHTRALAHVWHLVKNFREPERDDAQILTAVEHMRERVVRGDEFASVAREESDCPEHGGDLGYFQRGAMVAEFDAVVFAAPIAELTSIFRTRFGYHTAIVLDRKPEGIRALEEVEPEIEKMLRRRAQDEACGALIASLRKKALIEKVTE